MLGMLCVLRYFVMYGYRGMIVLLCLMVFVKVLDVSLFVRFWFWNVGLILVWRKWMDLGCRLNVVKLVSMLLEWILKCEFLLLWVMVMLVIGCFFCVCFLIYVCVCR